MSATASTEIQPPGVEGPVRGTVRCAGVGALAVAAAHLWAALSHRHDVVFGVLVATMTVGCVICAVRCLRTPCLREVRTLMTMSAAMALAHVAWLMAAGGGHHHSGTVPDGGSHTSAGLTMVGLALAEVAVTAICAVALRRHAAAQSSSSS
ncbi:hypothetical protein [Galactobacter sp.]|uniref:hypothetical protein n=1 Tax=Galactobacter sp. TaxID=2676125 RepID=UPI0025C252CA|nr:hypothetical protein [Galactobacter sp.]